MVIVGNYSVRLVQAETKDPFKEYTGPDGKFYAEVEPNEEYFIEVEALPNESTKYTFISYTVDGQKLDYYSRLRSASKIYSGLWYRVDGQSIKKSLKFNLVHGSYGHNSSSSTNNSNGGSICIKVKEAILSNELEESGNDTDHVSTFDDAKMTSVCQNGKHVKKALCSSSGEHVEIETLSNKPRRKLTVGKKLHKITVYYCTVAGLVQAGIFSASGDDVGTSATSTSETPSTNDTPQDRKRSVSSTQNSDQTTSTEERNVKRDRSSRNDDAEVVETSQPKVKVYTLIDLTDD